ncbi:endo-1,3(4)-beta-glucanase [Paracoccidioides lutzii Pb01]|uniref:glucan endo-1,3-beta-D-glucosidase n=2 Tax=Paracoccidioides TaxID=38946 RepID=C1GP04_PARBA|nr:endo-1,3(4)-beta-glucanase [Paracoccidioides lutzii Pb01]EEH35926.2 endo-1,3(4)-beta-glucanase [Paracoccidioides lutzii Pb01]
MLLMAMQCLPGVRAFRCHSGFNCPCDNVDVDIPSFSLVTQFPPTGVQPQVTRTPGVYHTELEKDVRDSMQPFPTGISYVVFDDHIGLPHPEYPHLDIVPSKVLYSNSACYYKGNWCPGLPHVEENRISSWLLDQSTRSPTKFATATSSKVRSGSPYHSSLYLAPSSTSRSPPRGTAIVHPSGTAGHSQTSEISTNIPHPTPTSMSHQDIFEPIDKGPIPSNINSRSDHPVQKDHISDTPGPISTNKFYANFFLGSQTGYAFVHPYAVGWAKGTGNAKSYGVLISHIESHQLAFGPKSQSIPGNPVQFYINPIGIQSMILSASELGTSTVLTVSKANAFSADIILRPNRGSNSTIIFPLVQGMGYVTGLYMSLQPAIQSSVFFRKLESVASPKPGIYKYRVTLEDNTHWLIYVTPTGNGGNPNLVLVSNTLISGPTGFSGIIQVAKNPNGSAGEAIYDRTTGVYPTEAHISGSVVAHQAMGTYKLTWQKAGKNVNSTPLLMFALPHHVQSFDTHTQHMKTDMFLRTTTKGNATACVGNSWTMVEKNLPVNIGFGPWNPNTGTEATLSNATKQRIRHVAPSELSQDISRQTNLNSMYFSGKALNKFAMLVYTVYELVKDASLSESAFSSLKSAFARFVDNRQIFPLVYDTVWKGVVSSGTYVTGDPGLDFGNTFYNDHHFHYGYFILAAAIIGYLDPSWVVANKGWVNTLVRDAGNSVSNDDYFPFSRAFDWYSGHSWAKGLFESFDSKDEESSSEDAMFAYAIKMWGKVIKDRSMEARGNMMLAILSRSFNNYVLMKSDNVNQPSNFIANKVTGILFENKADHTTYFGTNLEYIQGIHMLPLIPSSPYIRGKGFVSEEWNAMFAENASTPASGVQGGWQGILYANLAIIDPNASWNFFNKEPFDLSKIDGGATRTWYLAFAAGRFYPMVIPKRTSRSFFRDM